MCMLLHVDRVMHQSKTELPGFIHQCSETSQDGKYSTFHSNPNMSIFQKASAFIESNMILAYVHDIALNEQLNAIMRVYKYAHKT